MPTNLFGRKLREVLFRKQSHFLLFFLGFFLLLSCSKDKPEDEAPKLIEPTYEYLFQTSLEQSLSASSIRFIAGLAVEDAEQYNYQDVDVYRLTYKTQGPDWFVLLFHQTLRSLVPHLRSFYTAHYHKNL